MSFPLKVAPLHGDLVPPSNICFLGPTRVEIPNGISIGSAIFCIDHGRVSLYFTTGRPYPP